MNNVKPMGMSPDDFINLVDTVAETWCQHEKLSLIDIASAPVKHEPGFVYLVNPVISAVLSQCCVHRN